MNRLPALRSSLYRIAAQIVMPAVAGVLMTPDAAAQLRSTKLAPPRAIAVVQWPADNTGKAVPQLVPVIIRIDNRYFDAALYRATPRPMALEPGTVYEVQSRGNPIGYFTVQRPMSGKNWMARGDWKPTDLRRDFDDLKDRPQTAVMVRDKDAPPPSGNQESVDDRDTTKKTKTVYDEQGREIPAGQDKDDDPRLKNGNRPPLVIDPHPAPSTPQQGEDPNRPRMKRNPEGGQQQTAGDTTSSAPSATGSGSANASDDPDRPRMTRNPNGGQQQTGNSASAGTSQAGSAAGTAAPAGSGSSASDDPDRPRMTRGGQSQKQTPAAQPRKAEEDPNRPVLKRGKPQGQRAEVNEDASKGQPVPERVREFAIVSALPKTGSAAATTYEAVAVSDESDLKKDPVDFRYRAREDELKDIQDKMVAFAIAELGKTAAQPAATMAKKTGTRTTLSKSGPGTDTALDDFHFRVYDPNGNNVAVAVLSGHRENEFVTVAARVEPDGNLRKLFASHTKADRLDVTPRYELIDAVDADSDRRADLLFHVVTQDESGYALYKIGADNLMELFRTTK